MGGGGDAPRGRLNAKISFTRATSLASFIGVTFIAFVMYELRGGGSEGGVRTAVGALSE